MLVHLSVIILLSQINSFETHKSASRNIANDVKVSIRTALNPIVIYVNSFKAPNELEMNILIQDVTSKMTPKKVLLVMGKSVHFVANEAYKSAYPYYNKYSTKTIKSLREFFDSYSGQCYLAIYNPWTHFRDFKQGTSESLESIILSLTIIILVFLFNKGCYLSLLAFLSYFLYVYAYKSITTLFYLYVTLFSPILAFVAILQDHSFVVVLSLFGIYIFFAIIRKLTRSKCVSSRNSKFRDSQIAALHSEAIIEKLNQLEKKFNKISERLARLEKMNKKK